MTAAAIIICPDCYRPKAGQPVDEMTCDGGCFDEPCRLQRFTQPGPLTHAQILVLLAFRFQQGEVLSSTRIAMEYGVHQRTAQRWIRDLNDIMPLRCDQREWRAA